MAKDEGLHTILNPSPMFSKDQIPRFPWNKVDWLLINEGEGSALLQGLSDSSSSGTGEASVIQKLADIPAFKNTNIIYTLGSQGAMAYIPSLHTANTLLAPAARLQGDVRDTTGAGDCFTGFFVAGIMQLDRYTIGKEDVERLLEVCNQVRLSCSGHSFVVHEQTRTLPRADRMDLGRWYVGGAAGHHR